MKIVEREIKVLSHVKEIEKALDKMKIKSTIETQDVWSVKLDKNSFKLKTKESGSGTKRVFCKKYSVKNTDDVTNDHFSNKVEIEENMTKAEFKTAKLMFETMFEDYGIMKYVIVKKRYKTFKGYAIDVCKIVSKECKHPYYMDEFIEIEEVNGKEANRPSMDELIKILVPDAKDVKTITCGIRNLNKVMKKLNIIKPKYKNGSKKKEAKSIAAYVC